MPTLVFFDGGAEPDPRQIGGKAASLCALHREGFPVPQGFAIPAEVFAPWLEALSSDGSLAELGSAEGERLESLAGRIRARIADFPLPRELRAELASSLEALEPVASTRLYAVRSSSPEEDLDGSSFAGGYDSLLGVPADAVEAAIVKVFASAFSERVFAYKRERGYDPARTRMAVLVQAMVPAEASGVAFSLNPLTNCYDEAVVEACRGLGEALVSGIVEPDRFVVRRPDRRLLEARAGSEGRAPGATSFPALDERELGEIVDALERVESLFGFPVDLEWARAEGRLFILQARPITGFLPLPPRMVTEPGAPKLLYANSTLIEQGLDAPLSPLGADFLERLLRVVGGPVARGMTGPGGVTFMAGGCYFMNISYALKLGMGKASLAPGSLGDPRIEAILGSIDLGEYTGSPLPAAMRRGGLPRLLGAAAMARAALRAHRDPRAAVAGFEAGLPGALARLHAEGPAGESWSEAADRLSDALGYFYGAHGIPLILAGQFALRRIERLFRGEDEGIRSLVARLGSGLPGNKTTEMGEALSRLARAGDGAAEYLAAFGHRCPAEVDAATPRPFERPELLAPLLEPFAAAAGAGASASPLEEARKRRAEAYRQLREIARSRGRRRAAAFERAYAVYEALGGFRETPKHYLALAVARFRAFALRRGEELARAGRLDRPEGVFDLELGDLDRAARDPGLDLRALGRERRRIPDAIARSGVVARIVDSRGKVFYPPAPPPGEEGVLRGVPISPGTARGRAKLLRSAGEKPFLPGEVLVARSTDPGWTPLFIHASAIVLEIGGVLQHGAVVAREYGVPCVSGLDGALELLSDGDLVEVDGSGGTLRILEKAARA